MIMLTQFVMRSWVQVVFVKFFVMKFFLVGLGQETSNYFVIHFATGALFFRDL